MISIHSLCRSVDFCPKVLIDCHLSLASQVQMPVFCPMTVAINIPRAAIPAALRLSHTSKTYMTPSLGPFGIVFCYLPREQEKL